MESFGHVGLSIYTASRRDQREANSIGASSVAASWYLKSAHARPLRTRCAILGGDMVTRFLVTGCGGIGGITASVLTESGQDVVRSALRDLHERTGLHGA